MKPFTGSNPSSELPSTGNLDAQGGIPEDPNVEWCERCGTYMSPEHQDDE